VSRTTSGAPTSLLGVALVILLAACSPGGATRPGLPPSETKPTAPPALAEAERRSPRLRVQVTEVVRTGAEALTVKLRLLNPDAAAAVAIGDAFGDGPGDEGSLAGVHLLDAAGQKRLFVLRDDRGRPQCSAGLGAISPGGQIDAWGRYPSPAPGATRVTVQVPGLAPFRDLPIADPPASADPATTGFGRQGR
jgi:hypothetical protein